MPIASSHRATEVPHWIESGAGARALVCLHGVSGTSAVWQPLLERLARPGVRVIAWDMPGYRRSAGQRASTMADHAAALERMLDAAELQKAVLVGHSMGGMIALEMLARHPERIEAAVLACTTPAFGPGGGAAQRVFIEQRLGALERAGDMASLAGELIPTMLGSRAPPELAATHREIMSSLAADAYRAAIHALTGFDRRALLAGIGCPVLCVAGAEDRIAAPALMRAMCARIPGAALQTMGQAGHLAPFERPVDFCESVEAFVRGLG